MKKRYVMTGCLLVLLCLLSGGLTSSAQSLHDIKVPDPGKPMCVYCGSSDLGRHTKSCPYYYEVPSKQTTSQGGKSVHSTPDYNAMIAGTIFQSMLTSMFSASTGADAAHPHEALMAQQAEAKAEAQHAMALQQQKEAAFKAQHNQMMQAYKQSEGSSGTAFKSLNDSASGSRDAYKTLDDAEKLASNAQMPFDTPLDPTVGSDGVAIGKPTPFFGDTMPLEDIQLLVNPENDPRVVDLREAKTFVVENLKEVDAPDRGTVAPGAGKDGNPILEKPDCAKLSRQLNGYVDQRDRFRKTVDLAQSQVDTWQAANRNAMLNVALDGVNYFTGQLLEGMNRRGKAAARLEQIYERNAFRMAKGGVNIKEIEAKINKLKRLSSAGEMAELIGNISDWNDFLKNGVSSLISQMSDSNRDIEQMLKNPGMAEYFGEDEAELNALLDISKIAASNAVFGKWVAKKIPVVAGIELAVNQTYNATDWFLSFNRIIDANNINGKVLDTAKHIQKNIDDTAIALKRCSR